MNSIQSLTSFSSEWETKLSFVQNFRLIPRNFKKLQNKRIISLFPPCYFFRCVSFLMFAFFYNFFDNFVNNLRKQQQQPQQQQQVWLMWFYVKPWITLPPANKPSLSPLLSPSPSVPLFLSRSLNECVELNCYKVKRKHKQINFPWASVPSCLMTVVKVATTITILSIYRS